MIDYRDRHFIDELAFETAAVKEMEKNGWVSFKLMFIGVRGAPDRLFGKPGRKPLLIEFKKAQETPTQQQYLRHTELRACGFDVQWFDRWSMFANYVNAL